MSHQMGKGISIKKSGKKEIATYKVAKWRFFACNVNGVSGSAMKLDPAVCK